MFKSLEVVDDVIDSKDIEFVKISDEKIEVEFAVDKLPTLVYFENKIPIEYDGKKCILDFTSCSHIFSGNLYDPVEIQSWILEELESQAIRNVDEDTLEMLIDKSDDIVIIFFDGNKKKQKKFVAALDTVDDEAEKLEIFMVKNGNPETAR